jgi:CelD/BcsL family acetyltransferase involved in cellulose biosynthesis
MLVEAVSGEQAQALIDDPEFQHQWQELYQCCPWATVFQAADFVRTWYTSYAVEYRPVLITGRDQTGNLAGLFTLALSRKSGALVPAGSNHAEYHVWLARVEDGDLFIGQALGRLRRDFPASRLIFRFLPPAAPLGWLGSAPGVRCTLTPVSRGLMDTAQTDGIQASLRKKSNRSRFNRLQKLGPVSIEQITSPQELEPYFDNIIDYCDLRQGAINNLLPFRSDSLKRAFYLNMMNVSGLLHVTVLKVGSQLASAHLNVKNKSDEVLGLMIHSPFLARDSPGKLHILMLGLSLSQQGISRFDLTPGGDYKDRFASFYDTAYILRVFFDRKAYFKQRIRQLLVRGVKTALRKLRLDKSRVAAGIHRWRGQLQLHRLKNRIRPASGVCVYTIDVSRLPVPPHSDFLKRNSVSDVLAYRPADTFSLPVQAFLKQALEKLESGCHVYTSVTGGILSCCVWLAGPDHEQFKEIGLPDSLYSTSALIFDFECRPRSNQAEKLKACILEICRDLSARPEIKQIVAVVDANRSDLRQVLTSLGFRYLQSSRHTQAPGTPERSRRSQDAAS